MHHVFPELHQIFFEMHKIFPELHQMFFEMQKIFPKIMHKIFLECTKFSTKTAQNNF